jgi:hypothetical protein
LDNPNEVRIQDGQERFDARVREVSGQRKVQRYWLIWNSGGTPDVERASRDPHARHS